MSVVKNTLDGHGYHVCSGKVPQQVMSMRNVVHLKMNLKTVFKKHDQTKQTNSSGSAAATHHHQNGEVEMTDFSGDAGNQEQSPAALNSVSTLCLITPLIILDYVWRESARFSFDSYL